MCALLLAIWLGIHNTARVTSEGLRGYVGLDKVCVRERFFGIRPGSRVAEVEVSSARTERS